MKTMLLISVLLVPSQEQTKPDKRKVTAADLSKNRVELSTKKLLRSPPSPGPHVLPSPEKAAVTDANPAVTDTNPAVSPGQVNWHKDFAAACAASKASGKPVLLFHLLGQLDERFT